MKLQLPHIDRIWLLLMLVLGSALSLTLTSSLFELTVFISGILCVALIAIGRREGYLIGIYACLSYAVLAYSNGLFGEVYLNLYFFIPTNLFGYWLWHQHSQGKDAVAMRKLTNKTRLIILLACVLGTYGLGFLLAMNEQQNSPYIDALTNVLSVAATFLMMWRFKEQWLLYIAINVVSIMMWLLRAMEGGAAGDLMVLMWSLYLLNSLFGYWRWHIGEQQQRSIAGSGNTASETAT